MGKRLLLFILFFLGITNSLEGHMTSSPPLLSYEDCIYVICRSTPPTSDRSEFVIPSLFVLVWVANLDALYLH